MRKRRAWMWWCLMMKKENGEWLNRNDGGAEGHESVIINNENEIRLITNEWNWTYENAIAPHPGCTTDPTAESFLNWDKSKSVFGCFFSLLFFWKIACDKFLPIVLLLLFRSIYAHTSQLIYVSFIWTVFLRRPCVMCSRCFQINFFSASIQFSVIFIREIIND